MDLTSNRKLTIVLILAIIVIASFFRLWQLDSLPAGLYPDEAINGNEALSNPGQIFYPENNGREGLFINLIALSFSIFGISVWSLKIVAAIIGILTVFGLYLLTRELFNKNIALLSSFFLAVSFWHVNFSHIGFRAILVPFLLVFTFYFLFKGFRARNIWHFIAAGLFFGLGFHTYISFRVAPLIVLIIFFIFWLIYRKEKLQKQFILHTSYFLLLAFLMVLPIGIYFLENPGDFIGRATPVSIFSAENPIKEFGKSLVLHLGMFNFYGDSNWRHNFAGSPMLFWPIGILFLIGFFLSIKGIVRKKMLATSYWLLVVWFFIMLLPGILTYEGIPHALRTIGVIPVVYIFAGLGGWSLYQWLNKIVRDKKLLIVLCSLFIVAITCGQFCKYFLNWSQRSEVEGAFAKNYVEIGNYLNSLPPETQKYVIVNEPGVPLYGISIPAQTPMFIETTKFGQPRSIYLTAENLDQIKINHKKTVIIPLYNGRLFDELREKFPSGQIKEEKGVRLYEIK